MSYTGWITTDNAPLGVPLHDSGVSRSIGSLWTRFGPCGSLRAAREPLPVLAPRELDLTSGLPDGSTGAQSRPQLPNRPGYIPFIQRDTQG